MASTDNFELAKLSSVSSQSKFLFDGYIRKQQNMWKDTNNPYYQIIESIQHIILTFWYCGFHFDVYTPTRSGELDVSNNGKLIEVWKTRHFGRNLSNIYNVNAGYSLGHSRGVHKFKIRVNEMRKFDFGITTDLDNAKGTKAFFDYKGWSAFVGFTESSGTLCYGNEVSFNNTDCVVQDGTEIMLLLDCDYWKIEFFVNSQFFTWCGIEKDKRYYVCLSFETHDCEIEVVD